MGFLTLVRHLRSRKLEQEKHSLEQVFARLDKNKSSRLDITEVSALFPEIGVKLTSHDDQWEMKCLLNEVDTDKSGDLNFDEFAVLVQRIRERLDAGARRRQRLTSGKLGLSESDVCELRRVFLMYDTARIDLLAPDKLRQALEVLQMPIRQEELSRFVDQVDTSGTG